MPTAPASLTLQPFSMRAYSPRSQITILPARDPAGNGLLALLVHVVVLLVAVPLPHRALPKSLACTTWAVPTPAVMPSPTRLNGVVTPWPLMPVTEVEKRRPLDSLAAVITQGALPGDDTVLVPGPLLPAATTGTTPAARTLKNAAASSAVLFKRSEPQGS